MKIKLLLFSGYLASSIFIYGCSVSSHNETTAGNDKANPDSLVASLERTPCFGVCPHYRVSIYRSGFVLYEGFANVPNIGRFYTYLAKDKLKQIGEKAEQLGFFELDNEYRNPHLTDFPTIYIEVHHMGKNKRIVHYDADPPANLVSMEDYIDSLFTPATNWQIHPKQEMKN